MRKYVALVAAVMAIGGLLWTWQGNADEQTEPPARGTEPESSEDLVPQVGELITQEQSGPAFSVPVTIERAPLGTPTITKETEVDSDSNAVVDLTDLLPSTVIDGAVTPSDAGPWVLSFTSAPWQTSHEAVTSDFAAAGWKLGSKAVSPTSSRTLASFSSGVAVEIRTTQGQSGPNSAKITISAV